MYTDPRITLVAYEEHVHEAEQRIARIRARDERRVAAHDRAATNAPQSQTPTARPRRDLGLRRRLQRLTAWLTA